MDFVCTACNATFSRTRRNSHAQISGRSRPFCSKECHDKFQTTKTTVNCKQCQKSFSKWIYQIKKTNNNFCSQSCAGTYNNTHKTTGNRRSKLEVYLETKLIELYPNLDFKFNDKTTINSELDIYIPPLNLAFELNGIFHYEPIYGSEKLNQIQNNDNRKFQACLEKGISLCIIDTSSQKYFKESTSNKFLKIICDLIDKSSGS